MLILDIKSISLLLTALANITMGLFVLFRDTKDRNNIFYFLVSFSISIWIMSRSFFLLSQDQDFSLVLGNTLFITASLIPIAFILFSYFFGYEKKSFNIFQYLALFMPWLFILYLIVEGDVVQSITINQFGENDISYGKGFIAFSAYEIIFLSFGIFIMVRKYLSSFGIYKAQLRYVLLGSVTSIVIGITANVIFPLFSVTEFVLVGPIGTIFLIGSMGYAITRHRLYDFRVVTAHLFVISFLSIFLVEIFIAETLQETLFKVFIFILVLILSYFITKEAMHESERREKIEYLTHNLTAVNRRLQEIDIEKSDFISIASHQLRTPLTVIKGYSSMLMEKSFGEISLPKHKEIVEKISSSSERLVNMIDDFLNISQIEEGHIKYYFSNVDLIILINEIIDDMSATLHSEKLTIGFNYDHDERYFINADEIKIRQVISNLLDNAIKYTLKGGRIDVFLEKDIKEKKIILSISDNGIGISKDVIPKLFRKYSRASGMSHLHNEGTGLGLYVAKEIVDAHEGIIWVESKGEGMGSTFFVKLDDIGFEKN